MLISDLLAEFNNGQLFTDEEKLDILIKSRDIFPAYSQENAAFRRVTPNVVGFAFNLGDVLSGDISATRLFNSELTICPRMGNRTPFLTPDQLVLGVLLTQSSTIEREETAFRSSKSLLRASIFHLFSILSDPHGRPAADVLEITAENALEMIKEFRPEVELFLKGTLKGEAVPMSAAFSDSGVKMPVAPGNLLVLLSSLISPYSQGGQTFEAQLLRAYFTQLNLSTHFQLQAFKHDDLLTSELVVYPETAFTFEVSPQENVTTMLETFVSMFDKFYDTLTQEIESSYDRYDDGFQIALDEALYSSFALATKACAAL